MRHGEVAANIVFSIPALLLANDHHRLVIEIGQTRNNGMVIAKSPVPVDLGEVRKALLNVIQRKGALGVAGQLDPFPGQ